MNTIELRKQIIKDVANNKQLGGLRAQVVIVLDRSGSMDHLYESGFVQRVLERLVPVAMQFDDNGEMELYMFENKCTKHPTAINERSVDGIVARELSRYNYGGTSYAPPIKKIIEDYVQIDKGGFFSKSTVKSTDPVYVIFITDGENSDREAAENAIKEASKYGIFFQFVGIGNADFIFLNKLDTMEGRYIDNANFFPVNDLDKVPDGELYERLLGEFPLWIKEARSKNIIK